MDIEVSFSRGEILKEEGDVKVMNRLFFILNIDEEYKTTSHVTEA